MDKREAKRKAYEAAYWLLEQHELNGGDFAVHDGLSDDDAERVRVAFDELTQWLYERSKLRVKTTAPRRTRK